MDFNFILIELLKELIKPEVHTHSNLKRNYLTFFSLETSYFKIIQKKNLQLKKIKGN